MRMDVIRRDRGLWIDLVAESAPEMTALTTLIDAMGREKALDVPFRIENMDVTSRTALLDVLGREKVLRAPIRVESFGCDPDDDAADLSDPKCPIHSIRLETFGP